MSQQSAFDRELVEETAAAETTGLLEQLNLPPAAITFIRKNQKAIWAVTICIVLVVVSVSLYGSYRIYQEDKASSALTLAMKAEGEQKKEQLQKVVEDFGATTAALWSRVELAHIAAANGDFTEAVQGLLEVKKDVSLKNPINSLLLYNLAVLYEKNGELTQALATYTELSTFKGFEKGAYEAMGRLYELQGNKEKALEMYKKYMDSGEEDKLTNPLAVDPDRQMIEARIITLEN